MRKSHFNEAVKMYWSLQILLQPTPIYVIASHTDGRIAVIFCSFPKLSSGTFSQVIHQLFLLCFCREREKNNEAYIAGLGPFVVSHNWEEREKNWLQLHHWIKVQFLFSTRLPIISRICRYLPNQNKLFTTF